MIVMMIATTPSVNASSRPLVIAAILPLVEHTMSEVRRNGSAGSRHPMWPLYFVGSKD
jgi:hypothetical protein